MRLFSTKIMKEEKIWVKTAGGMNKKILIFTFFSALPGDCNDAC
jgi:hypothetical protein